VGHQARRVGWNWGSVFRLQTMSALVPSRFQLVAAWTGASAKDQLGRQWLFAWHGIEYPKTNSQLALVPVLRNTVCHRRRRSER
jgi:hypothetical protein